MFNKILYINLDRRPDRNEHIIKEINSIKKELTNKNIKCPIERITAFDGRNLTPNNMPSNLFNEEAIYDTFNSKRLYYVMTKGAAGCAISHYNTYQKIINEANDTDKILILEDDITFDKNFISKLENHLKNIPDYDILFLGYHLQADPEKKNNSYSIPDKIWGLFGYIINKKAAKEICKVYPLKHQIDTEMPKVFKNLKVFSLNEKLIISDESQNSQAKFGTDTQIREGFKVIKKKNNDYYIFIFLIILLYLIIYLHI
jgi:GR25 family glycosyltransferase involved in LPS biosynthesis